MVYVDFNAYLSGKEEYERDKDIVKELAVEVLEDMLAYFLPHQRSWPWDGS